MNLKSPMKMSIQIVKMMKRIWRNNRRIAVHNLDFLNFILISDLNRENLFHYQKF